VKKQKNKFFNVPQLLGDKETLKNYFEKNLIYPKEAIEKRIEGTIILKAEISDNGEVLSTEILKGLGGGCNEEAVRLIKNLKFGAVKNKGIRLKSKKRFKIKFQLPPENKISYNLVQAKKSVSEKEKTYTYTIKIKQN
jgi:TonB family protein